MVRRGTKPREILNQLQIEDPNCTVSLKAIYNQVQIVKQQSQIKPKEEEKNNNKKNSR